MVVNSGLEDPEGRMRSKRVWKVVLQVGKKEEKISGREQWFCIETVSSGRGCWWTTCILQIPAEDKSRRGQRVQDQK